MFQNTQEPYPSLHNHDDSFDYKRDVTTATERSRQIMIDIQDLLQNMQSNIVFNLTQLIGELNNSKNPDKEKLVASLTQTLSEFQDSCAEVNKKASNRVNDITMDLAAIPDIHGIDHICSIDFDVCKNYTYMLISLYDKVSATLSGSVPQSFSATSSTF